MTLQDRQTAALRRRLLGDRGVDAVYRRRSGGSSETVSLRLGAAEGVIDTRADEGLQLLDGTRSFRAVAADLVLGSAAVRPRLDGSDSVLVDDAEGPALGGEYRVIGFDPDSAGVSYLLHCQRVEP